jgi:hypothetical protein
MERTECSFAGGPANGRALLLHRAPRFLRVTFRPEDDYLDALDRLDDKPNDDEQLVVYRLVGEVGVAMMTVVDPHTRKRQGLTVRTVNYQIFGIQPDEPTMRCTAAWRKWTCETEQALKNKAGTF